MRKNNWPRGVHAFSLMEVVLALGVVSMGLIGILSVIPVALTTAKDSQEETRVAQIAQAIFSDLRARRGVQIDAMTFQTNNLTNAPFVLAYTRNNEWISVSEAEAFYVMTLTMTTDSMKITNGWRVKLDARWPKQAAANAGSSNSFNALIGSY